MKGRIPQPIALHVANGTYRKDRHGNTLEAQAAIPKTPSGMNKDAAQTLEILRAAAGQATGTQRTGPRSTRNLLQRRG